MIFASWKEYRLSRLMLGTAQFGKPYGVANRAGQLGEAEVRAIVAAALAGGVNCFDTAAAYGPSEELLGRALVELGAAEQVVVVTKINPLTDEAQADPAAAAEAIEQSVAESRLRLRMDCLPVVLFHREADAMHGDALRRLAERGWLRHAGVSCENCPGPAAEFVADDRFAAVQLPGNLLDRRHRRSGVFALAADRGVAVFLRSVYLQGLLVMPETEIPAALKEIVPVRGRLENIARDAGLSLAELALRSMLAAEGATCILTGVETVEQVRENLEMFDRGPLPADVLAAVDAAVPELPEALITPALWPPRSVLAAGAKCE